MQKASKRSAFRIISISGPSADVKLDPTVIMRIELAGEQPGAYYWRGMSLDYFDGIIMEGYVSGKVGGFKEGRPVFSQAF